MLKLIFWIGLIVTLACLSAQAQAVAVADSAAVTSAYRRLLPQIEKIPIFDGHGHPGYADDPDVDAMAAPPGTEALRVRADNPELALAAKALFGYPYTDFAPEHAKWLTARKAELKKSGPAYFDKILDQVGISVSLANRVAMPDYLDPKRFHWVCFVDSFLFPFDNREVKARNPDEAVYLPLQEKKLKRELTAAGLREIPATFGEYLAFVTRTLEENKKRGAVAVKFEAAYFRSLEFGDPPEREAAAVYERYHAEGVPQPAEYVVFQDYLFRHLLREAGRLALPVHFHSSVGIGDFFNLGSGNALNLENVLRDPRYERNIFVLLHGAYPFDRAGTWLAARRNVYLDSSLLDLLLYPAEFSRILQHWLEIFPEKIMFGSDVFPLNEALGAEECYWLAVKSTRSALAGALARMVALKEVSEEKALRLARMYLHDNAAAVYGK
ncbi:MAG: amidohydrolase family protein [Blastocatellia bacterium]|nr:amidohydrolase family protein [Blastocatellia bacterium]